MEHFCEAINNWSKEPLRRVYDAQGIYLCRVCEQCEPVKLAQYRPEILSGYSQADVDEPIEPEDDSWHQEIAMEEGMLHGVGAYNDARGCSLGGEEEHGHHCFGTGCECQG